MGRVALRENCFRNIFDHRRQALHERFAELFNGCDYPVCSPCKFINRTLDANQNTMGQSYRGQSDRKCITSFHMHPIDISCDETNTQRIYIFWCKFLYVKRCTVWSIASNANSNCEHQIELMRFAIELTQHAPFHSANMVNWLQCLKNTQTLRK